MVRQYDVIIAGGGMVGVTLACALATVPGLSVLVLDRSAALKSPNGGSASKDYVYQYDARSITLARGSAEIFHQMGVWSTLRERATPIQEILVTEKGQFGQSKIHAKDEKVPALGYVVENHWLMQVLYDYLSSCQSVTIEAPSVIQQAKPNEQGYHVEAYHQQQQQLHTYQASLLVVADGAGSSLRDQLGISVDRFDYQQSALVTNMTPDKAHEWKAHERFTDTGPLAILPLNDQRCAVVWTLPPDEAERLAQLDDESFIARLQQNLGSRSGQILRVGKRVIYPLEKVTAKEQVRPNLVVLGNAAHALHPVAGQGFNLSVRDVAALTRSLRERQAQGASLGDLENLLGYQRHRQADQSKISQFSDKLLKLFLNGHAGVAIARNVGLITFDLWPGAKKMLAKHAMGTLTYTTLH